MHLKSKQETENNCKVVLLDTQLKIDLSPNTWENSNLKNLIDTTWLEYQYHL